MEAVERASVMKYVVGVDVGGTFTDCVVVDEDGVVFRDKSFTVPSNPGQGMVNALENVVAGAGLSVSGVLENARAFAIGTTSLTNKLITRGGAKVGFITTRGHEDAILIGRIIAKSEGLSEAEKSDVLCWSKPEPIVARKHIRGVSERMDYKGSVIVPMNEKEVIATVRELLDDGVEAIAICLLWGFINPAHEHWIQNYIVTHHPGIYVATGSSVAPVLGEYERANSTILSAHLGALARREMDMTKSLLASRGLSRPFLVMQSNGGCMWDEEVQLAPLNLIASGPAGGIIGCSKLGERMGYRNIVATDMGGTSFDVGVITNSAPILANIAVYDRTRIALPHVEVISIGAGGGSIAWVDEDTGLLHVGPRSAGSVPGPVAYGNGGEEPTVTDADVVLGRIDPARFFSGRKMLDRAKAEAAIKTKIAGPLGLDLHAAAKGILDIVDSRMGDLIRKLTIERGVDPRDFVLFSYGGAGPTHVGAYAREVGIQLALVSPYAAVFSALGIGSSDIVRVYSVSSPLRSPFDLDQVNSIFGNLEDRASKDLERRGVTARNTVFSRSMEMRFRHQSHQVKVPVPNGKLTEREMQTVTAQFVELYEQAFGLGTAVTEAGIEILIFQVVLTTHYSTMTLRRQALAGSDASAARSGSRQVFFDKGLVETPIYEHSHLEPGNVVTGPAIIEAANTTVPLHPGQELTVDAYSNLAIRFLGQP
jgi:N-methylhydantoinase A